MTDALIESYGTNLEEAFDNAARGLVDTMVDIKTIKENIEEKFEVSGRDLKNLLYNWLESVLVKVTLNEFVFSSFNVKIQKNIFGGFEIKGVGLGEKLDLKNINQKLRQKLLRIT